MPDFRTRFRRCPSCSRRFGVGLSSRREVSDEADTKTYGVGLRVGRGRLLRTVVDGRPAVYHFSKLKDNKVWLLTYKCNRCGHQWSETKTQTIDYGRARGGYTGD